jgi:hypothetical protein
MSWVLETCAGVGLGKQRNMRPNNLIVIQVQGSVIGHSGNRQYLFAPGITVWHDEAVRRDGQSI